MNVLNYFIIYYGFPYITGLTINCTIIGQSIGIYLFCAGATGRYKSTLSLHENKNICYKGKIWPECITLGTVVPRLIYYSVLTCWDQTNLIVCFPYHMVYKLKVDMECLYVNGQVMEFNSVYTLHKFASMQFHHEDCIKCLPFSIYAVIKCSTYHLSNIF